MEKIKKFTKYDVVKNSYTIDTNAYIKDEIKERIIKPSLITKKEYSQKARELFKYFRLYIEKNRTLEIKIITDFEKDHYNTFSIEPSIGDIKGYEILCFYQAPQDKHTNPNNYTLENMYQHYFFGQEKIIELKNPLIESQDIEFYKPFVYKEIDTTTQKIIFEIPSNIYIEDISLILYFFFSFNFFRPNDIDIKRRYHELKRVLLSE